MASLCSAFGLRLLVVLPAPNEVRRFMLARAFGGLAPEFAITYVLPAASRAEFEPLIRAIDPEADLRFVEIDAGRLKAWQRLFKAACYRYAERSPAFAIQADARYAGPGGAAALKDDRTLFRQPAGFVGNTRLRRVLARILARVQALWQRLRRAPVRVVAPEDPRRMLDARAFEAFKARTLARLGPDRALAALIDEIEPALVIVPTALSFGVCNDVMWLCAERRTGTVVLQSGWDHLSSRGVLFHRPDFVGAWGPQGARHAAGIQGLDAARAVALGAPHLDAIQPDPAARAELRRKLGVPEDRRSILVAGSLGQFDELAALRRLDDLIAGQGWGVTLLYRPHPDRPAAAGVLAPAWRHVIVAREPEAALLSAADAVIAPLSTLLVEALLRSRPVLAVAFGDAPQGGAALAAEMAHFEPVKRSAAVIWCDDAKALADDAARLVARIESGVDDEARRAVLADILVREPGSYGERLAAFVRDTAVPFVLRRAESDTAAHGASISHHYGADAIAKIHVGLDPDADVAVPGYWMHGWLPASCNRHAGLVAQHKIDGVDRVARRRQIGWEKQEIWQWVGRPDQAESLKAAGYRKVEAIGVPFAYLPAVEVERRPGSLLVMPPHSLKSFYDPALASRYAAEIAAIRGEFSEVVVCLTERDYYRGEWRCAFQSFGIPVIVGADHRQPNTLLRMKRMFSSFEFVTTNAMGSQIAYAAHCGAKVSVYGPFVGWDKGRSSTAIRLFPDSAAVLQASLSEEGMRAEMPFLFCHPARAELRKDWGDEEIGCPWRRPPQELKRLFGWEDAEREDAAFME